MGLFKKQENKIYSPVDQGEIKELVSLNDGVFSEKMLGDGFVVSQNDGNIYSPIEGEIVSVFPTNHAYGIRNKNGLNVLVHIGIDTVELDGKGFQSLVKAGDKVNHGDLIAKVDLDILKKAKVITDVICVVTSDSKIQPSNLKINHVGKNVSKNEIIIELH